MKISSYLANRIIRNEEPASKHINVLTHYDDDTLIDKSGKLIKIIKLSGIDFVTQDERTLDRFKFRRNNLLKNISSEFAFYFWDVRRKILPYLHSNFVDGFAKSLNDAYQKKLSESNMFHTELYLGIITKQPEGLVRKSLSFFRMLNFNIDKEAKKYYLLKRHDELNNLTRQILNMFSDYHCELLSSYEKNQIKFSAPLKFVSQLINYDSFSVAFDLSDASKILPRKRLFFNSKSGSIEMRFPDERNQFAAILSIKRYSPITYQGMLNELHHLSCEYTITQSFRFYDRQTAKSRLRDQQKEMQQSQEESITQTEEIEDAYDDAASGEVGYGKHHFTLACYADSQEELNKHIGLIVSKFSDRDIACVREDVACELGYWSQLPGNFSYIARSCDISTKNMASFASFHNYSLGKPTGNYWGDAVTILETLSGSPYYFNFHYKDVGNFLVFGAMGSGKTLLVGFLIAQSMKFGGKRIIFDKDRGLEIFVRAVGGTYERIKPGIRTGFNPCHLADTLLNRKFLSYLFKTMLTINQESLTEHDLSIIESAVEGLYRLDKSSRQLCHIASFFGVNKKGSLRARFDQWHSDGAHAWLFDNQDDYLNLNADVLGFDLGSILSDKDCKIPALMYLIHRVEQTVENQRGLIFIDEGILALNDDYCRNLIDDWSRTFRKKNNIFGLATQVAGDTIDFAFTKAINESAACKIFFPNPSADQNIYVEGFGLSEHEYHLIKTIPDHEFYFLLIHGRGTSRQSVVVRPNLKELDFEIAVISAREHTLALFDQIRSEVGDDPKDWLPVFRNKIRVKSA